MGSTLTETLRLVIAGDSKGAVGALRDVRTEGDKTDKAVGKWGERMNTASNYALGAGVAMAGVIGVSLRTATDYYSNGVDTINDLTDLSTEGVTRLLGQTKAYGIEAETTGKAVKFFERNLDEARQGTATYLEAFERLGFTQEELKNLTDEEILFRTRDAMAGLESTTSQTAIAMQLFGRAGAELSDWYDVAPDEIAKVNEKLEELGLVWGDKEIKTYQDMVDAQRDLQLTMLSLQLTVARDVVPALTPLIGQFGKLLQLIRPLMPALPYLTAGLFAFGGTVKAIQMVQFINGLFRSAEGVGTLARALPAARRGLSGLSGLLRNLPALLTSTGGMYGLIAAGIAVDSYLIYEAVKAWDSLSDAIDQAREAEQGYAKNAASALDRVREKYGENSAEYRKFYEEVKTINEQAQADAYKYPWWFGPGAWLANMGAPLPGWKNTGSQIPGLASEGLVKASPGGTIVRVAEGGEDEVVLKASRLKGGGGRSVVVNLTFSGPVVGGRAGLRELSRMVQGDVMAGVQRGLVGQNG